MAMCPSGGIGIRRGHSPFMGGLPSRPYGIAAARRMTERLCAIGLTIPEQPPPVKPFSILWPIRWRYVIYVQPGRSGVRGDVDMRMVTVQVWDATGNKRQDVEMPLDTPVKRILAVLLEKMR